MLLPFYSILMFIGAICYVPYKLTIILGTCYDVPVDTGCKPQWYGSENLGEHYFSCNKTSKGTKWN